MRVKDFSVSGECFSLIPDKAYGFLKTEPQPEISKLPEYYTSENYISHTDAKRNTMEKVYHWVRKISIQRKLKIMHQFSKKENRKLLDFGCGTGSFLVAAKQQNWNVVGVEPNEKARNLANKKVNNQVLTLQELEQVKENSFDVITLWHVLEHLPNLDYHINLFQKLLKPDGTLLIAVPNYKSFDANYYKQYWAAYDVPRHLWHFSSDAIKKLFTAKKMKVFKTYPMLFDAYYVSLLSEYYKTGKQNKLKAFYIGTLSNLKAKRSGAYSSLLFCIKNQ